MNKILCVLLIVLSHAVTWQYAAGRADPQKEHCLAALDTFERMRLGVLDSPAMQLPKSKQARLVP